MVLSGRFRPDLEGNEAMLDGYCMPGVGVEYVSE